MNSSGVSTALIHTYEDLYRDLCESLRDIDQFNHFWYEDLLDLCKRLETEQRTESGHSSDDWNLGNVITTQLRKQIAAEEDSAIQWIMYDRLSKYIRLNENQTGTDRK